MNSPSSQLSPQRTLSQRRLVRTADSQSGAALIVGLIFLVVLTLLGITAMQTGILEERMAGNARDRNIAFQAAEAALRDAEHDIHTNQCPSSNPLIRCISGMTAADEACNNGLCCTLSPSKLSCIDRPGTIEQAFPTNRLTQSFCAYDENGNPECPLVQGVPYGTYTLSPQINGPNGATLPNQPRYVIEPFVIQEQNYFRITSQGYGANSNTTVTLQEVYKL